MTSIPVKDVGSVLMNASKVQGSSVSKTGDFQAVWDAQTGKGVQADAGDRDIKTTAKTPKTDKTDKDVNETKATESARDTSAKTEKQTEVKENGEVKETEAVSEAEAVSGTEELTDEELEAALEVLGTAAYGMMQEIADLFGISMKELQATMDALGMEQTDVLKASELSNLLLQIGGAQDSYALVTDENLYTNYRALMNRLDNVLAESAEALGVNAEELEQLVAQISEETVEEPVQNAMPVIEVIDETAEAPSEEAIPEENEEAVQEIGPNRKDTQNVGFENSEADTGNGTGMQNGQERKTGAEHSKAENPVHQVNEFATQNFRTESFANQVQTTAAGYVESPWDAQTLDIMRQITDSIKIQITAESQNMELQLHPASLGNVQVNVASKNGVITANFVTENETVKAALETQMIQLRESFAEQGVKVEAIEVTVQPHAFERNLDQGRGNNNNQEAPKRSRVRRIRLDDALSIDDLNAEEKIAAEMMAANGSTVDYTV